MARADRRLDPRRHDVRAKTSRALHDAVRAARAVTDRPSLIVLRTIIAWPAPDRAGHRRPPTARRSVTTRWRPPRRSSASTRRSSSRSNPRSSPTPAASSSAARRPRPPGTRTSGTGRPSLRPTSRSSSGCRPARCPTSWSADLPTFPADAKGMATRKASGAVINAIAGRVPELWGGSADLAGSNNTTIDDVPSFIPKDRSTDQWSGDPLAGRVLHFGIREHGMGGILNGIALHGGTRVFGGTFLTFSDYMRGSVRLAALMGLPVTYVWTHDSIGLGEDGPTHQPIEHLAALRAIPGLDVVRPADANETAACWQAILERTDRPAGLALTPTGRAGLPARRGGLHRHLQRAPRRLRAARRRGGPARRRADRHRLGGAARRRGPRPAGSRRRPGHGWCRCRAESGSTTRSRPTARR